MDSIMPQTEYQKEWVKNNPEKVAASKLKYYELNKQKLAESRSEHYFANKPIYQAIASHYYQEIKSEFKIL